MTLVVSSAQLTIQNKWHVLFSFQCKFFSFVFAAKQKWDKLSKEAKVAYEEAMVEYNQKKKDEPSSPGGWVSAFFRLYREPLAIRIENTR